MLRFALGATALTLATAAAAQDADRALIIAMTAAIEDAGCVVTAENGDAVLADAGLTEDQTMSVIAAMYAEGLITLTEDGNAKLINETCQ